MNKRRVVAMRGLVMIISLTIWASVTFAQEDWNPMTGTQIATALNDTRINYETGYQVFHANGRTLYAVGSNSWGRWRVQGDQYCSQWPPSDHWDCYDMALDSAGLRVRFISGSGRVFEGSLPQ